MTKQTIAGMRLWEVDIEYDTSFSQKVDRTLTISTRGKSMTQALKKAASHLKAFRFDYPKARITGIRERGWIDA